MILSTTAQFLTALNAKRFLKDLFHDLPFPLISIQVDGGSE